jgi:NADH:ubiquinone oxidoreductase subunit D
MIRDFCSGLPKTLDDVELLSRNASSRPHAGRRRAHAGRRDQSQRLGADRPGQRVTRSAGRAYLAYTDFGFASVRDGGDCFARYLVRWRDSRKPKIVARRWKTCQAGPVNIGIDERACCPNWRSIRPSRA